MVLYVDVLFAINFSMDFIAIFLCNMILRRKINRIRILVASVVGGLYGVIAVFLSVHPMVDSLLFILVALIICYISFYNKSIKKLISSLLLYLFANCLLGGIMSALFSLLNRVLLKYFDATINENVYSGARFFIIASIAIMIAVLFGKHLMKKKESCEVLVKVTYKGETYNVSGLSDSGNMLSEPITGKAVILISEKSKLSKCINLDVEKNIRYIPYSDISNDGLIKGVIPEKIVINEISVDAIIAPIKRENFGEYEAIVPSSLV